MSVLKSKPVADAIASATTSPMRRTQLAADDFLQLVSLAQLGAALSALALSKDDRAEAIRLVLEAAGGLSVEKLPPHEVKKITAGDYKGCYRACVTEGPHAGVFGIGREAEAAKDNLAGCLQVRTRPGRKRITVGYIAQLGAARDAELLIELRTVSATNEAAAQFLATVSHAAGKGKLRRAQAS